MPAILPTSRPLDANFGFQKAPSPSPFRPNTGRLRLAVIDPARCTQRAIEAWHNLSARSLHQSPFLLPEFVLSGVEHLGMPKTRLYVVHREGCGEWLGLAALQGGVVNTTLPLTHARAAMNHYTYRTGLLVDSANSAEVLDYFFDRLPLHHGLTHGLEFEGMRLDSVLAREIEAACERAGYAWRIERPREVPVVFPELISGEYLEQHWSSSLKKQLRRGRKFLEQFGPISMQLARTPSQVAGALETFLQLEKNSWKGEAGTACASNARDERFIRSMVGGLAARGHVVLSELRVGDRVAASAINLSAGGRLFAFKIGWDRELAKGGPGVLHEAELLQQATGTLNDHTLFDSCATNSSYIAGIWPDRIPVATGLVCFTKWSRLARRLYDAGRRVKRRLVGIGKQPTAPDLSTT